MSYLQPPSLAIGSSVTGATAGSVFFAGAAGVMAQDNAGFFWDNTAKRLQLTSDVALRIYNAAGSYYTNVVELRSQGYNNSTYFQVGEGAAASFSIFTGSAAGGYFRVCDKDAVFNAFQFYTYSTATQRLVINAYNAATVGQIINLAAAQSADAFQVKDSSTAVVAAITKDGYLGSAQSAAYSNIPNIFNLSDTNTGFSFGGADTVGFIAGGVAIIGYQPQVFRMGSDIVLGWASTANAFGAGSDIGLARSAAGIVKITNGSTGGGALHFQEQTAPSAPATNNVYLYAEDNGGGKTRLMALFPTGVAQQVAIEP